MTQRITQNREPEQRKNDAKDEKSQRPDTPGVMPYPDDWDNNIFPPGMEETHGLQYHPPPVIPPINPLILEDALIREELKDLATELVKAIDEIEALPDPNLVDFNKILDAAMLACKTLKNVLTNKSFRQAVSLVAQGRTEYLPELVSILRQSDKFHAFRQSDKFCAFLEKEDQLLMDHGVKITNTLNQDCREKLLDALMRGEALEDNLIKSIEQLQSIMCDLITKLKPGQSKKQDGKIIKKVLIIVKRAGVAMIGIALVAINVTTSDLSPTEKTLSALLGGGVVEKSVGDLIDFL